MKEEKPKVGAGKLCPMRHKSIKDYNRKQERQEIEKQIQDYSHSKTNSHNSNSKVENLLNTAYKTQHKLDRYNTRLLKEGLRIAKEQNIRFALNHDKEFSDASEIIKLAENTMPSLYRRSKKLIKRYITIVSILEKKVNFQN